MRSVREMEEEVRMKKVDYIISALLSVFSWRVTLEM